MASLKSQTCVKRGGKAGYRTRVSTKLSLPKGAQWQRFLKDSKKKDELFQLLTALMYSKNYGVKSVNEARKLLFTHSLKSLDSIPHDPACLIPAWEACPVHCSFCLEAVPLQNSRDS